MYYLLMYLKYMLKESIIHLKKETEVVVFSINSNSSLTLKAIEESNF